MLWDPNQGAKWLVLMVNNIVPDRTNIIPTLSAWAHVHRNKDFNGSTELSKVWVNLIMATVRTPVTVILWQMNQPWGATHYQPMICATSQGTKKNTHTQHNPQLYQESWQSSKVWESELMICDMLLNTNYVIMSLVKTKHVCYIRTLCLLHSKHSLLWL
jgi:hypothetical protein